MKIRETEREREREGEIEIEIETSPRVLRVFDRVLLLRSCSVVSLSLKNLRNTFEMKKVKGKWL